MKKSVVACTIVSAAPSCTPTTSRGPGDWCRLPSRVSSIRARILVMRQPTLIEEHPNVESAVPGLAERLERVRVDTSNLDFDL